MSLYWLWVSILVMLDSSLRLLTDYQSQSHFQGFNPCYVGFIITTFYYYSYLLLHLAFQSLLCWIHHYDSLIQYHLDPDNHVSILVMLDSSLRQVHFLGHRFFSSVSILVMLDSSLRPLILLPFEVTALVSILVMLDSSLRQTQSILQSAGTGFQSLLCWIHHYDNSTKISKRVVREVSILVMLDSSLRLN